MIANGQPADASDFVSTSAGAGDSGKVPKLDGTGKLDVSFVPNPALIAMVADEDLTIGQSVGASCYSPSGRIARALRKNSGATLSFTPDVNVQERPGKRCAIGGNKFVFLTPASDGENIYATVGELNPATKTITLGTSSSPTADGNYGSGYTVCKLDTDKFVVFYMEDASTTVVKYRVGTVSGTTITWGTAATAITGGTAVVALFAEALATDKGILVMKCTTTPTNSRVVCFTNSGTTLTFGTAVALSTTVMNQDVPTLAVKIGTDKFLMFCPGNGSGAYAQAGTISGTTITLGTAAQISASSVQTTEGWLEICSPATDVAVFMYGVGSQLYMNACTVSGTTITAGTQLVDVKVSTIGNVGMYAPSATEILLFFDNGTRVQKMTLSGANLTSIGTVISSISSNQSRVVVLNSGEVVAIGSASTTFACWVMGMANMFLGIVQSTVSKGGSANVLFAGKDSNQSGLIQGALYVPNGSGGFSLVASTSTFNTPDDRVGQAVSATELII